MFTTQSQLDAFKRSFPQEKIVAMQERQGADHNVLEINHTWICKSAKTQAGIALLEREVQLLKMLQGKITTQIPMPVVYESNFLVYKKIPGSPLISYLFYHMSPKKQMKLASDVAQFLHELHIACDESEIKKLGFEQTDWPWSPEKLQAQRHLLADKEEMVAVFDGIMQIYEQACQQPQYKSLIHNDMSMKNIIVDPLTGLLRGVIDFTDVAYDDFGFDLRMRRENSIDFVKMVAMAYMMDGKSQFSPEKLYGYYFATEFSRYFELVQQEKVQEAQKLFHEIVKSANSLLVAHDDCKEKGSCSHAAQ